MSDVCAESLAWIAALNHAADLLADPANHMAAFDDCELFESTKTSAHNKLSKLADELRSRALKLEQDL